MEDSAFIRKLREEGIQSLDLPDDFPRIEFDRSGFPIVPGDVVAEIERRNQVRLDLHNELPLVIILWYLRKRQDGYREPILEESIEEVVQEDFQNSLN